MSVMANGATANKAAVVINANIAFTGSLARPRKIESNESFSGTRPERFRNLTAPSSSKTPAAKAASVIATQFWLINCSTVTDFSPDIPRGDTQITMIIKLNNNTIYGYFISVIVDNTIDIVYIIVNDFKIIRHVVYF